MTTEHLLKLLASTPSVTLSPVLQGLSARIKGQLSDTLANNEVSTDEELVEFFTDTCKIPADVALAALKLRGNFLRHPFFDPFEVTARPKTHF